MEKNEIIETLRANRTLLEQFHIRSLSVFGSIVRGEAGPDSDVDILVEFDPGANVGLFPLPGYSGVCRISSAGRLTWRHRKTFTRHLKSVSSKRRFMPFSHYRSFSNSAAISRLSAATARLAAATSSSYPSPATAS